MDLSAAVRWISILVLDSISRRCGKAFNCTVLSRLHGAPISSLVEHEFAAHLLHVVLDMSHKQLLQFIVYFVSETEQVCYFLWLVILKNENILHSFVPQVNGQRQKLTTTLGHRTLSQRALRRCSRATCERRRRSLRIGSLISVIAFALVSRGFFL